MSAFAVLLAALPIWWVDPYGDAPYLPTDEKPAGGVETNVLSLAAARGEIETISFCVRPEADMKKVDFVPSDLTGPGGEKLSADAADFALVKVWYRADGRWGTSWAGNVGKPTLIPDLILHDDDLIRVVEDEDVAKRTIKLRFSYPDRTEYVDMRKHWGGDKRFLHELHPVMDAPKFVPFDLKANRWQQYWFTWKVPAATKPGLYKGTLAVKEDGKEIQKVPVELEVYPFVLPWARTHYDTSRRYINSWMGVPSLAGELANSKNLAVSERKVFNIYKSCAEHNSNVLNGPGTFGENSTDDLQVRSLILARQAGMYCDMLINGSSLDPVWCACFEGTVWEPPEQNPEKFRKATAKYEEMLKVQRDVLEQYLGHHCCYFQSADECGTYLNRRSYPFWALLHKYGFEAWTDSGIAPDISWSVGMNDAPASARHIEAWNWHRGSSRVVSYAGTFSGPSCPDMWRRVKGLRYYYADFDGLHEYDFNYNRWNQWDDYHWRGSYSQFVMCYFTYDGLISTLAWEGDREAIDDVRYLSLLRMRAEAAMKSDDPKIRALGKQHYAWMDLQDPEGIIDLHAFRREVARRAIELIKVVGPQPEDKPLKPAPELPPCTYGANVDPKADKSKLALEYEKKNRYDLAMPMWQKVLDNPETAPDVRFEAATHLANCQSYMLLRDQAVKTIEDAVAVKDMKGAQRAKLLLQRVSVLLSDKVYEEEFTVEQLGEAAKAIAQALKNSGASEEQRFAAIFRLVNAYHSGGEFKRANEFSDKMLADVKLCAHNKGQLYLKQAEAHRALAYRIKDEDDRKSGLKKAAQMYRIARKTCDCQKCFNRNVLKQQGFLAEELGDWKTAQACYGEEVKMYSSEEEDLKAGCVARISKVTKKLAGEERKKDVSFDATDDGTEIELDD